MSTFDFEQMDVYVAAIDFVATANEVVEHLPRGRAYLADQLQRAATSIALNIAEGAGEFSVAEKSRFYRMAKRSATECAAILHVCQRLGLVDRDRHGGGRELLLRVVAMLVKLIHRAEDSGSGTGTGTRKDLPAPAPPFESTRIGVAPPPLVRIRYSPGPRTLPRHHAG